MSLFTINTTGSLEDHLSQEWLLTNGIGGFAYSTVVGCNTRRYHGLLCAATIPPVGRVMTLNRIGEVILLDNKPEPMFELSVNQFDHHFHPRGDRYLQQFELDHTARWHYQLDNVRILKEVQLLWEKNIVGIRYTIEPDQPRSIQLQLLPFVSLRDFHALRHGTDARFHVSSSNRSLSVSQNDINLHLQSDQGCYLHQPDWWRGHTYAVETHRGLDDHEELFNPGRFIFETSTRATVTLWASITPLATLPDWDAELTSRQKLTQCPRAELRDASPAIRRLTRAANDFVVYRKAPNGRDGTSVLAGYPWFSDWGRDTMISLPGLLLTTGRFEQARHVLSVFAEYVSQGMIPNRFDDYNNEPHYNTVDASLWFIHAVFEYLRLSKDQQTFDSLLLPACRSIIQGYRQGTRFHIRMDESDGLITQGDHTTQLTWMDAKCDGVVFTPRHGKAVEINALWYNALMLMGQTELAAKVAENFRRLFWISPFRGLADVVHEGRRDLSLRPNQIFAASLPHSPLTDDQQSAVVEIVRRELLTPFGLRTLAKSEPGYIGQCKGPPCQRDAAYHNGTIWPWPIGAFLDAWLRVNKRSPQSIAQARQWLQPLIDHLDHACIGQISEIFDGDLPHLPGGCPAQAWSVAEVLRLAVELKM